MICYKYTGGFFALKFYICKLFRLDVKSPKEMLILINTVI